MSVIAVLRFHRAVWMALAMFGLLQADLERHPVSVGTSIDFGRIVKGRYDSPVDSVADGQVLTRTGVYLTESGTYNKRLSLKVTVGGLFWWPLPETKDFQDRIIRFGPGVGQAQVNYAFGDPENPSANLQLGLFPIKYNPDAKNLGEYMYRSGTYPGTLYSGGWSYMNAAAYMAQGIRFTWNNFGGKLIHDFTLTLERDMEPVNNLSPSYLVTLKPASFFELGAGVIWAHGIQLKHDSIMAPRKGQNAYVKATGLPLSYNDTTFETDKPHYASNDPRVRPDGDPAVGTSIVGGPHDGVTIIDYTNNGIPLEQLGFYTFRGFKTMARASLDLGTLFGWNETMGKDAFKFYGEVALLGVENQPFLYEDRSERMPLMFGANIPTFKFFDMLGLEFEYRKSRFRNTLYNSFNFLYPISTGETDDYSVYDLENGPRYTPGHPLYVAGEKERLEKEFKKDDWKWSLYAKKQIFQGLTLFAQAASDHSRHITAFVRPMYFPATERPSEWYYILRLELGI